jgi:hypothetical protein
MEYWVVIILGVLLAWIIFYSFYKDQWNAAADRIQSKSRRRAVKIFLKVSYVVSTIAIIAGWIWQIVSLFSNKNNKA